MTWDYRDVLIEDDKSIGDSGTETIDLDVQEPITALLIRFKVNNGANLTDHPPARHITKVEIVDGGQSYWSLNGWMAVAAAIYGLDRFPHHWTDARNTANQRINFPILFGRYLGDEKYAFNSRALRNPQLKITWEDYANYTDDAHTLGVTARVMEGLTPPGECLLWKEIEAWTTAATGTHKVELPVDHTYRALLMRCWEAANLISNTWDHYKLDCDLGKFLPFDMDDHEMLDVLKMYHGPYDYFRYDVASSGDTREAWFGETLNIHTNPDSNVEITKAYSAFWSFFYLWTFNVSGTALSDQAMQNTIKGYFPMNTLLYPFGRPDSPETWFDPRRFKKVDLKIDESNVDAEAAVAVQQVVPLP